jgi:hypothetical protein
MIVIVPRSRILFGAVVGGVIGAFIALLTGMPEEPAILNLFVFGGLIFSAFLGWQGHLLRDHK